ncbi:MAG: ATP-DEPENDENT PROTEASE SUBUNIT, partial [uncultured Acetobacteraceae bacterium]
GRLVAARTDPHRRGAGTSRPAAAGAAAAGGRGRLRVGPRAGAAAQAGAARVARPGRAAAGHRPAARPAAGEHAALRARAAGEQRHALGRARHGQVVPGEGGARGRQRRRAGQPCAGRDPPGRDTHLAGADGRAAPAAAALPSVLRRPFLRAGRQRLQSAEIGAGRRHRGAAGERAFLRHLQPTPPDAARHDRERAEHSHQPVGGDGGEGVAVRPLRTVDRLPQLRPADLLRHGRGLRGGLEAGDRRRGAAAGSQRMVRHARGAIRAGRVAVHPGFGGAAGGGGRV